MNNQQIKDKLEDVRNSLSALNTDILKAIKANNLPGNYADLAMDILALHEGTKRLMRKLNENAEIGLREKVEF